MSGEREAPVRKHWRYCPRCESKLEWHVYPPDLHHPGGYTVSRCPGCAYGSGPAEFPPDGVKLVRHYPEGPSSTSCEKVRAVYDRIEDAEPDISTERLLQQTADECAAEFGGEWNAANVADALIEFNEAVERLRKPDRS